MSTTIDFRGEINSDFSHKSSSYASIPSGTCKSIDDFELPFAHATFHATFEEELSGKAHLANDKTRGISLLVSAVFFGVLALMFPYASVPCAIYTGLSVFSAVAGGVLLFRNPKVEIPLASDFYDFC